MIQEDCANTEKTISESEELSNQYHPAFCNAMMQIFENDGNHYEYQEEYELNTLPNRIDFLVIKVVDDEIGIKKTALHNGIGKICRKYNIFEYKSPGQQLSVDEFYKTMGYSYFFAYNNKDCSMDDITITFVREGKPKKLLSFFKGKGYNIIEYEKGIYHVLKKDHVDMQVVVTSELGSDYLWLKALSDKLTFEDALRLVQAAKDEKDEEGKKRISSILDLTSRLNADKAWMKEDKNMQAFWHLFEDEFREKDEKIEALSEQLQSKEEQLQSKDEQLQSKDKEIERLKALLKKNKIAMF